MSDHLVIDPEDLARWADDGGRHPQEDGADGRREQASGHTPEQQEKAS